LERRAIIVGTGETPYERHPSQQVSTAVLLARAAAAALSDAQIDASEVDGLGVASLTLAPDRGIDLAVSLGISASWLMDGATGGASALDMLQHARRAIEAGDAHTIVLAAGDQFSDGDFAKMVNDFNTPTARYLRGIPTAGPNPLFALLTARHMERYALRREDYGQLVVAQRALAESNPNAAYRDPLTLEEYLAAPVVSDPLGIFDCPPIVSGADAVVLSAADGHHPGVRIRAMAVTHNADSQLGDGLSTGLAAASSSLWDEASAAPSDVDVASVYDDYPVMILIQLSDLGFARDNDVHSVIERIAGGQLPVNTAGGQLSAGQAGAAGGLHGLVEVVRQLNGTSRKPVARARLGLVTGYGMVAYRYGASAHAALLDCIE
jgi:acetyl-CoA acetyltransferase